MTSSREPNSLGQVAGDCHDVVPSRGTGALEILASVAFGVAQSDIHANSPRFASVGNQEFDHSEIQGLRSVSTSPKRKPSVDEMHRLLNLFGAPAGKKRRTRTSYHRTPSAIRSRFIRWFPDFHDRFRYDEASQRWVPRHHNGSVFKELDYRSSITRSLTQTEVRDDKGCLSPSRQSVNKRHNK